MNGIIEETMKAGVHGPAVTLYVVLCLLYVAERDGAERVEEVGLLVVRSTLILILCYFLSSLYAIQQCAAAWASTLINHKHSPTEAYRTKQKQKGNLCTKSDSHVHVYLLPANLHLQWYLNSCPCSFSLHGPLFLHAGIYENAKKILRINSK